MLFSENTLKLSPTNVLVGMRNSLQSDFGLYSTQIQSLDAKISKLTGVFVMRTPQSGAVQISSYGEDSSFTRKSGGAAGATSLVNTASILNSPTYNPDSLPVFVPGTTDFTPTKEDVEELITETTKYFETAKLEKSSSLTASVVGDLVFKKGTIQEKLFQTEETIKYITELISMRANGTAANPELNTAALARYELRRDTFVTNALDKYELYVQKQIIDPYLRDQDFLKAVNAQLVGFDDVAPTFDLEFGPPVSVGNSFVLASDGLYYNSRTAKVPDIQPSPTSSISWELQFDSNRGGRGVSFSEEDGEDSIGTIFNLNEKLDETNPVIQSYYEFDDILQQFSEDKQTHLLEVSGYIAELISNGYSLSDAVVKSYYGQLGATASVYDRKITKRKRQLQIAALFGRDTFFVTDSSHSIGAGVFFQYKPPIGKVFEYKLKYKDLPASLQQFTFARLEGGQIVAWNTKTKTITKVPDEHNVLAQVGFWQQIPRIPINDFSYLRETDIPLNTQKKITLFSEDLDTIIAPYQASYVVAPIQPRSFTTELAIDDIGLGDWVHRETSASLSSTVPLFKSLTDDIVADELIACYNFLDPQAVTQPSSNLFALNNAAEGSTRLDAKLVGFDRSFVFPSGVGIAYMGGTLFDATIKHSNAWTPIKGSYAVLPNLAKDHKETNQPYNGTRALDNLFYSGKGVSFDFWAYIPNLLTDLTAKHRYRLILANENSGPVDSRYVSAKLNTKDSEVDLTRTIGMIVGWRDRGIPNSANSSGLEFVICPTVGQNLKSVSDPNKSWGHSVCIAETWNSINSKIPVASEVSQIGMFITSGTRTLDGSGIGDCSGQFCHFNLSFDYGKNEVRVVLDGQLLSTSSLASVLGGGAGNIGIATAAKIDYRNEPKEIHASNPRTESFLGNSIYDARVTDERAPFPIFTPWIIGGGFTDNIGKLAGTEYRPLGFLGSNTNHTHQGTVPGTNLVTSVESDGGTYIVGQHNPPLSSSRGGSSAALRDTPRSGLDGFVGSFKIYSKPLTTTEAKKNYDSQKGFFKNILLSS